MQVTDIFQALGEEGFREALRTVSIGRLKTYQLYESLKTWSHLPKLNVEGLRRVTPRFWQRVGEGDQGLAADLAQAVLVSNLDMVIDLLNFLGVPHNDGFFEKDLDASDILKDDWQQKAFEEFKEKYPAPLLTFYLNHLASEVTKTDKLFKPVGAG